MSAITVLATQAIKELEEANQARIQAGYKAGRAEGYRLWKLMRSELKESAPGGQALTPYREISTGNWFYKRKPLSGLWRAVRYRIVSKANPMHMEIGAVDSRSERRNAAPSAGDEWGAAAVRAWGTAGLSNSWVNIFARQQTGFSTPVPEDMGRVLAGIGGHLLGKGKRLKIAGAARFFFLRKSTTRFTIPARDIVDTFWRAHAGESQPNIVSNYERILRGEKL